MAVPDMLTKIKSLIGIVADFFFALADRITERIPEENRRLVLISIGGGFAVIMLVIIGTSLLIRSNSSEAGSSVESTNFQRALIPPDELFLPDEPDFVPGVLLEREQRSQWAAEDAAPWWQDPMRNGEEQWRARIEITIDEMLERVP
ncbi:MAG: hypothetical protein LBH97_04545 [Treponema sp.]|jgi:hypothetical protein|nr:hypothetical protein [Treponema sp.]